ncbi:MAG: hypothetical protein Q9216_004076 [Gyalolechia sp. 2 TL-2023]
MADNMLSLHSTDHTNDPQNGPDTDQEREARLRQIQMEALGTARRDLITTDDFDNGRPSHHTLEDMERYRRINKQGKRENSVTDEEKKRLGGWNTAWTTLKDDNLLERGLEDLNFGQSHRERLQSQCPPQPERSQSERRGFVLQYPPQRGNFLSELPPQSPADPLEEATQFLRQVRGSNRPRGSGRGGRGGGFAGAGLDRHAQRRTWTPKLTNPNDYMSAVFAHIAADVKGKAIVRPHSLHDSTVEVTPSDKPFSTASVAERTAVVTPGSTSVRSVPKVPSGTVQPNLPFPKHPTASATITEVLLDTNVDQAKNEAEALPSQSYAEDLMDLDFDQSDNLVAPIPLSMKVKEQETQAGPSSASPDLQEIDSQLASFLPILQSRFTTDVVEKFLWVRAQVQQSINKTHRTKADTTPTTSQVPGTTLEKSADFKHSAGPDITNPVPAISKDKYAPTRSLSNTVEGRTQEWSKTVITNTGVAKGPIFGEHVTRSQRPNSRASTASSGGLAEALQKLKIQDEQPPFAPQITESSFASVNPFGAAKGQVSSSTLPAARRNNQGAAPSFHGSPILSSSLGQRAARSLRATGPRPPGFLNNAPQSTVDPGAAARAQYLSGTSPTHQDDRRPAPTQPSASRSSARAPAGSQASEHRSPAFPAGASSCQSESSSEMNRYTSGGQQPAFHRITTRPPEVAGWISKRTSADDPAAASRAQYGGKENDKR